MKCIMYLVLSIFSTSLIFACNAPTKTKHNRTNAKKQTHSQHFLRFHLFFVHTYNTRDPSRFLCVCVCPLSVFSTPHYIICRIIRSTYTFIRSKYSNHVSFRYLKQYGALFLAIFLFLLLSSFSSSFSCLLR